MQYSIFDASTRRACARRLHRRPEAGDLFFPRRRRFHLHERRARHHAPVHPDDKLALRKAGLVRAVNASSRSKARIRFCSMKSSFIRPSRDRAPTKRRSSSMARRTHLFTSGPRPGKKRWPTALRRRSLRLLGRGATIDGKKLEPRSLRRPREHQRAGGRNAGRTARAPRAERALQQRQCLHFARSARDARLARRSRPTGSRKVRARRALHRRAWFHRERDRRFIARRRRLGQRDAALPGTSSDLARARIRPDAAPALGRARRAPTFARLSRRRAAANEFSSSFGTAPCRLRRAPARYNRHV